MPSLLVAVRGIMVGCSVRVCVVLCCVCVVLCCCERGCFECYGGATRVMFVVLWMTVAGRGPRVS